ncbi:uncharacterized protein DUF861 [Tenacibaculum adriaticum]|uniref:Uncharacterized protein DUF861 n=1 Tax=Tenacibaculum adriaticum TaxID=413713 RepID=A0A5S5DSV8_9FLAO|nr:cupin domain-containing protein [Tenacibaculum adriaticum]TYP98981.1 uncharacterized protein DUF861 [Tenacibaculum adriaticum]
MKTLFKFILISIISISQLSTAQNESLKSISIDKIALSGLNLKPKNNKHQPERKLFQKNLFIGSEIGVFIVASETAVAKWDSYVTDEFIFVLNGRARLQLKNKEEFFYNKNDFFIAPRGFEGVWETQGGKSYYHELAVVALNRKTTDNISGKLPVTLDNIKLAGINITPLENKTYSDILFEGIDLTIKTKSESSTLKELKRTLKEELIYVLAGKVTIISEDKEVQTFYTNDFFVLPKNFSGIWKSEGHNLFRSLHVAKTK